MTDKTNWLPLAIKMMGRKKQDQLMERSNSDPYKLMVYVEPDGPDGPQDLLEYYNYSRDQILVTAGRLIGGRLDVISVDLVDRHGEISNIYDLETDDFLD